jgi:hypothetical protein
VGSWFLPLLKCVEIALCHCNKFAAAALGQLFSAKTIAKDRQAGPLLADEELVRLQLLCRVLPGLCPLEKAGKNGRELGRLRPGG